MSPSPAPAWDVLAQVFGCVSAAAEYAYSTDAAIEAAFAFLKSVDEADLRRVAAALAGYMAADMKPRDATWDTTGVWSDVNMWLVGGTQPR